MQGISNKAVKMNEKVLRLRSKGEALAHIKHIANLRSDLIAQFGTKVTESRSEDG